MSCKGCVRRLQLTKMEGMVASRISSCVAVCNRRVVEASYNCQVLSACSMQHKLWQYIIISYHLQPTPQLSWNTKIVFTYDANELNQWFFATSVILAVRDFPRVVLRQGTAWYEKMDMAGRPNGSTATALRSATTLLQESGANIANYGSEIRFSLTSWQLRLVVYDTICRGWDTSKRWLALGFLNHQQFLYSDV